MATRSGIKFNCYLINKPTKDSAGLIDALSEMLKEIDGKLNFSKNGKESFGYTLDNVELNEISKADMVLFESTSLTPELYYGVGIAQALGKPVISLIQDSADKIRNGAVLNSLYFPYSPTKDGLDKLQFELKRFLKEYSKNPLRFRSLFPYSKKISETSYLIDIDKLNPREYENLCFELISQMGFKKVSWGTEIKDFDLIATLPKKDPDGYEYQELWLIVTGNNSPSEKLLDMTLFDPEYLLHRLQRVFDNSNLFSRKRNDSPITILFVLRETESQEIFERRIEKAETHMKRRTSVNIRIRLWDQDYLTRLIQTYPQIAFKYFSEQSRAKSKYRKTPEELYQENISLTEKVLTANALIEEEKRKRFIAERETAWKDVAFKAAHKLGNPVDATDTYLQSLKRKLSANDFAKASEIAEFMDKSIEEAKSVIGQFKSLTKIEEINAEFSNVVEIINNSCANAKEQGVDVEIKATDDIPKAFVDPARITECINELVANSLHWFNKEEKKINIDVRKLPKKEIPEALDSQKKYLEIIYSDNGIGVLLENKEKIFSPFFSTYQHGTGLGLSILKKVIELQEGWIVEDGVPDEGAVFKIYLPLQKPSKNQTNK